MHSLVAYYESVDPAGAFVNLNAVPDQHVFVSGDDIRVPYKLNHVIGSAVAINDLTVAPRARLESPSLRSFVNYDLQPIVNGLVFGNPPEGILFPDAPLVLTPDESLNLAVLSNPAAAVVHYGLVWLADGPQPPVKGAAFSVRATAAATLSAGLWVNSAVTFSQTLPAGKYQIVGMRAVGTNLVAARLVFIGAAHRPGVAACNLAADNDHYLARRGGLGVFGEFDSNTPPSVDCLGVTDTAQEFVFDIMRVR